MRKLTIGIDASRAFGPEPTGTETYATEVIGRLAVEPSYDFRLYTRSRIAAWPPGLPAPVVLRPPRLWTQVGLAGELLRRPPDVLFVPSHVLPLVLRVPAVVTVHDLGHRVHPEAHTQSQRAYLEWSARHHVARARCLIADSQATRDDLTRMYEAPADRIEVIHLGVSARFRPAGPEAVEALRSALELPGTARYVAHVGTVQPRKNLERLVEAFAVCAADRAELVLLLAGRTGWGGTDPLATARRLGVADRVRRLGYVAADDLPALYTGAAATVFPSLYEGFGLPALEAMACGGAVAVSRNSSLPEVVGDAGLVFDPLDVRDMAACIGRLADEPGLRRDLGVRARERAAMFTWDRCAERTLAVIERAAGRGS